MADVGGGCYCGNIRLDVSLSRDLSAYDPRACDCDFCQKHGAAYVSDARGSLRIWVRNELGVNRYRQGSNTAEMLLCRICGVLVGALYREGDRLFGTINVKALDARASFGAEQSVSPKSLSADEKTHRWREIWFPNVSLAAAPLPDTPVLETARLVLRPLRLEDAPAVQRHFANWDIVRWLTAGIPWPYPADGAETYIRKSLEYRARGERFFWAICLKEAPDELIGVMELLPDDGSHDQRRFWIAPEFQGRGLMTEAADRVTEYAFLELGWPQLWLTNAASNAPSHRVKERQGAQLAYEFKKQFMFGMDTAEVWLLKSEEWKRRRNI